MASLIELAKDPAKRRAIVEDAVRLLDAEVAGKRGFSGKAVKLAFRAVKGVSPGMIPMSIDALLDDFCDAVDPFWAECQSSGGAPRPFFGQRAAAVANALGGSFYFSGGCPLHVIVPASKVGTSLDISTPIDFHPTIANIP